MPLCRVSEMTSSPPLRSDEFKQLSLIRVSLFFQRDHNIQGEVVGLQR
ncbi:hypothetical protein MESS2_10017 [Mesorhizobium metallidurans STM 2683]|uniref:Uncharacterized protein n=1 Tax=Mesorhizobium metallidurans STM 2683 TaxID=1297569 RepID=M5ETE1_9HYPH|nr:hypothetical protein MESS2_10017 [Mesorhizobium metallidurans STM 2683]